MNAVMLGLLRKSPLGICLSCTLAAAAAAATVDAHDVAFRSQGVTLRGIVMVPKDVPVVAAIVMVHGAGQEKRNLGFATAFAERGIAALTYDKRGVGQSGGVYAGQEVGTNNVSRDNLELLSLDAAAALRVLGMLGHVPQPRAVQLTRRRRPERRDAAGRLSRRAKEIVAAGADGSTRSFSGVLS